MPRIQIGHDAARALKVAAAMQDKRPHVLMEDLIMRHCAPHAHVDIEPSVPMVAKPDVHEAIEPSGQVATCPHEPQDIEKHELRQIPPLEEKAPDDLRSKPETGAGEVKITFKASDGKEIAGTDKVFF